MAIRSKVHACCGVDEVGRGPLAGPLVVCACLVLPTLVKRKSKTGGFWHPKKIPSMKIADSKKLTAKQREYAAVWLRKNAIFTFSRATPSAIDAYGMGNKLRECFARATCTLIHKAHKRGCNITDVYIDGTQTYQNALPTGLHIVALTHGERKSVHIAAASILAKVARDSVMRKLHTKYPNYSFDTHKGYGTKKHYKALQSFGMCPEHRQSFLRKFPR